jgi:hypothetical protein
MCALITSVDAKAFEALKHATYDWIRLGLTIDNMLQFSQFGRDADASDRQKYFSQVLEPAWVR